LLLPDKPGKVVLEFIMSSPELKPNPACPVLMMKIGTKAEQNYVGEG